MTQSVSKFENVFSSKKVVITGGLGFIGSNLAHRLTKLDCKIFLVDSLVPEYGGNLFNISTISDLVTVNTSDVRNSESIKTLLKDSHFIFNLAGQTSHLDSMKNPFTDLEINATAQLSILEICREVAPKARIVYASTRQIYGRPTYLPVDELHPIAPVDINGINKTAGEWYHLLYHKTYGIPATVLRLTNTYGPRMRIKDARQTFLGIWIKNLILREEINIFGDGEQRRDFNYIDDVVDALLLSASTEETIGNVYNLGSYKNYSLLEVGKILTSLRKESKYRCIPFPHDLKSIDIGDYYGKIDKFNLATGWTPQTSLENGLKLTVDYYTEYLQRYI